MARDNDESASDQATVPDETSAGFSCPPSHLPSWQLLLSTRRPSVLSWPVTRLCLPGTHDSATYGAGSCPTNVARFNWNCQSLNIYQQANIGIRYFDLRLERESTSRADSCFWPFHGAAKKTGDKFADGPFGFDHDTAIPGQESWPKTIAAQLLRFANENPSELLVLHVTVKDASEYPDTVYETLQNTLGQHGKCVPSPDSGSPYATIPSVAEAREQGYNFIILMEDPDAQTNEGNDGDANVPPAPQSPGVATFVRDYIWKVPGKGALLGPYNFAAWKSNDPSKIHEVISSWVARNQTTVDQFGHFWAAQCQLTPSINNAFDLARSVFNTQLTTNPKKLAGIMNPYVLNVLLRDVTLRQHLSLVQVDFAEPSLVSEIVGVNFDGSRGLVTGERALQMA